MSKFDQTKMKTDSQNHSKQSSRAIWEKYDVGLIRSPMAKQMCKGHEQVFQERS